MIKILLLLTGCSWCCFAANGIQSFTVPYELVHQDEAMPPYCAKEFVLIGDPPDGVSGIKIRYLPPGVDHVSVVSESQELLVCSVRSFRAGDPGFPLTIGMWVSGESSQAQVAISGVSFSKSSLMQRLSFYEPCLGIPPRVVEFDERALGINACSDGKTTFSINQGEMDITRIMSGCRNPDARALYVSARLEYAKLRDVVVRWGVCNAFGDKAEMGHHTFSFT